MNARNAERPPLNRRISLHLQVAILLAIAVLPIGAVGIWQAWSAAEDTSRLAKNALIDGTRLVAEEERAALTAAVGAVEGLSKGLLIERPWGDHCSTILHAFIDTDPRYVFSAVLLPDGKVACASTQKDEVPKFVTRWRVQDWAADPEKHVRLFGREPTLDTVTLNVISPMRREGRLAGSLMLSMPISFIETVTRVTGVGADFRLALLDSWGNVVAEDADLADDPDWLPDKIKLQKEDALVERVFTHVSRAGESRSYAVVPIFPGDIFAVGSWRHRDLNRAASRRIWRAVLFPATMWILALAVSYFAVYRLAVRHITYLRRVMRAFEGGRRNLRASKLQAAPMELAELGQAFDRMAETIERDERQLQQAIDEKSVLLREVYHRVKNNLQLVISMMNLQLRKSRSEDERAAIDKLQNRIMGLAAVHQRLYQATHLTAVRCDELLQEVARNICDPVAASGALDLKLALSPLVLGPKEAIPLSLFATECLMNAVKYSGAPVASVAISLRETDAGDVELEIWNSLQSNAAIGSADSGIGSELIRAFARQLNGDLKVRQSDHWYRVTLTFPPGDDSRA